MPRLAKMRHRVKFKLPDTTKDALGGHSNRLGTFLECWAMVEPGGGRDFQLGGVLQSSVTHKVTVRYNAELTAAMILELPEDAAGKTPQLRIHAIQNEDMANVHSVCFCSSYKDGSGNA